MPIVQQGITTFLWYCRQNNELFPLMPDGSINSNNPSVPLSPQELAAWGKQTSRGGCFRRGPGAIAVTGGTLTFSTANMAKDESYVFRVVVIKHTRNSTAELTLDVVAGNPPIVEVG